jgi:hypothetical protein
MPADSTASTAARTRVQVRLVRGDDTDHATRDGVGDAGLDLRQRRAGIHLGHGCRRLGHGHSEPGRHPLGQAGVDGRQVRELPLPDGRLVAEVVVETRADWRGS